jgi:exosortase
MSVASPVDESVVDFRAKFDHVREQLRRGPALFWTIALAAHLPLMYRYMRAMWRLEHYQYIPLLIVAVAYIAWSRWTVPIKYPTGKLAKSLFLASMVSLLLGSLVLSPWTGSLAFVFLAASFLVNHGLGYLAIPMVMVIRAPLGYDTLIIASLQTLTTRIASFLLDLLAIPHYAQGNVIELADRELFVAEACSGVQSAFTIGFIALLVVAWRKRPLALIPFYLMIALMWAVLCNTLRVTVIAVAASVAQVDLSEGLLHDTIGYVALAVAILLTLSTDTMLALLFRPLKIGSTWQDNPLVASWNWLFDSPAVDEPQLSLATAQPSADTVPAIETSAVVGVSFPRQRIATIGIAVFAGLTLFPVVARSVFQPTLPNPEGKLLIDPAPSMLDGLPGTAQTAFVESMRDGADPRLGMHADQWRIQRGPLVGTVIFSQPYPEWHNLNVCYTGQGWVVDSAAYMRPGVGTDRTEVVLTRFKKGDGSAGYLFFSGVTADGSIVPPPGVGVLSQILERCANWLTPRVVFAGDTNSTIKRLPVLSTH